MALGKYSRARLGLTARTTIVATSSVATYAMAALNAGFAARFTARGSRDIKRVRLNWSAVSAPGTVQVRVETIDTATGKPSGTLYDPAAAVDVTPAAGNQTNTFATLPTAGLVDGDEYAVVLLTTVAGTTQTLRGYWAPSGGALPTVALTAADGTTRSNFAEVSVSWPCVTLVMEDDEEEAAGMCPFPTVTGYQVYGTLAVRQKFVAAGGLSVGGVDVAVLGKTGTPGNLRARILDAAGNLVTGAAGLAKAASLATGLASGKVISVTFPAAVALADGSYSIVVDQSDHTTTSGNRYSLSAPTAAVAALVPSAFSLSSTTNVDATPVVWTDAATEQAPVSLVLEDAAGGGGGAKVYGG